MFYKTMEGFFEFVRIVMHGSCLVALILCIILVSCMLYSAWKDNKEQKKQKKQKKIDYLVIYHVDRNPDYIPITMIESILFDNTHCAMGIYIKDVTEELKISKSAMLKIEKLQPEKISIYSYERKRS